MDLLIYLAFIFPIKLTVYSIKCQKNVKLQTLQNLQKENQQILTKLELKPFFV